MELQLGRPCQGTPAISLSERIPLSLLSEGVGAGSEVFSVETKKVLQILPFSASNTLLLKCKIFSEVKSTRGMQLLLVHEFVSLKHTSGHR